MLIVAQTLKQTTRLELETNSCCLRKGRTWDKVVDLIRTNRLREERRGGSVGGFMAIEGA